MFLVENREMFYTESKEDKDLTKHFADYRS